MEETGRQRQDEMTTAERMKALALGQRPDRVPFLLSALGFSAQVVGYPIARIFDDPEKSFWAQVWTQEMFGSDGGPSYSFSMSVTWDFGGGIKFPTSQWEQVPEAERYPVESEADVERLEVPQNLLVRSSVGFWTIPMFLERADAQVGDLLREVLEVLFPLDHPFTSPMDYF